MSDAAIIEFWAGPLDGWTNDTLTIDEIGKMPAVYRPPSRLGGYGCYRKTRIDCTCPDRDHYVYQWAEGG